MRSTTWKRRERCSFEFTVELAWKTLKDYLEHGGAQLAPVTPKTVVTAAFSARLIPDGQLWVDMLNERNRLSHDYDGTRMAEALLQINRRYLPAMEQLLHAQARQLRRTALLRLGGDRGPA